MTSKNISATFTIEPNTVATDRASIGKEEVGTWPMEAEGDIHLLTFIKAFTMCGGLNENSPPP